MQIDQVRSYFPGMKDKVFLDAACTGLLPIQARDALRSQAEQMVLCPARNASQHHIDLDRTAAPAREHAATLIGANADEIALMESTTHGLQAIAATVPLEDGDQVLLCGTEYLGVAIPWLGIAASRGIRIDVVPTRDGRIAAEDFRAAMTPSTRLLILSSVQWCSGYRADLGAISELCADRDILFVVDAIQQLGAIKLNVETTPVDFLVAGGHKWLNAPVGRGFLYENPRCREKLHPPHRGYLNMAEPRGGWETYFATPTIPAVDDYAFVDDARRYEIGGTANYPGNVALSASLALINGLGIDTIETHIRGLTDRLLDGLRRSGAELVTDPGEDVRSGIVTFTLGRGTDSDRRALEAMLVRRIYLSQRYTAGIGGLRASVHLFNNEDDVDVLCEAVSELARAA